MWGRVPAHWPRLEQPKDFRLPQGWLRLPPPRLDHGDSEDWLGYPKSWARRCRSFPAGDLKFRENCSRTRKPTGLKSRSNPPSPRWPLAGLPRSLRFGDFGAPATEKYEGLADAGAANPFVLPRNSLVGVVEVPGVGQQARRQMSLSGTMKITGLSFPRRLRSLHPVTFPLAITGTLTRS